MIHQNKTTPRSQNCSKRGLISIPRPSNRQNFEIIVDKLKFSLKNEKLTPFLSSSWRIRPESVVELAFEKKTGSANGGAEFGSDRMCRNKLGSLLMCPIRLCQFVLEALGTSNKYIVYSRLHCTVSNIYYPIILNRVKTDYYIE